ncbi:MAG: hypothetical protein MUE40_02350 [Anaerolineae bacterium]|nr:hypothetical protein [Anaerolineae bacterium]
MTITHAGKSLTLERVLIDTGAAACVFKTDDLVYMHETDILRTMRGVGGIERVIQKQIDRLEAGGLQAAPFTIQMGAMDYGLPLDGILGSDFWLATRAVINFATRTLQSDGMGYNEA